MKKPTATARGKAPTKTRGNTREQLNQQAREHKRRKKRRGNPPGSKANAGGASSGIKQQEVQKDPRSGSKKPIPLNVTGKQHQPDNGKPALSPEDELAILENDAHLDRLLQRLEQGETLDAEEQRLVNNKLDRIADLMRQAGLSYDEDEDENPQDIMRLLKGEN